MDSTSDTSDDDVWYWVIRVVPPVAIIVVIIIAVCLVSKYCCKNAPSSRDDESASGDLLMSKLPPSSAFYDKTSVALSISESTSSGSEGYGSLQSHPLLLGRHAASIHEIPGVEEIQYIDIEDHAPASGDAGQILLTLRMSRTTGMSITVHEALNLAPRPSLSEHYLDPYVRILVCSNEEGRLPEYQYQTPVKKRTKNPVFEETFSVSIAPEDLVRYALHFSVINYHKFSRKDVIGEISIPLRDVTPQDEITQTYELKPPRKKSRGEILLSLSYLPTSNRLLLGVMQARNLTSRVGGSRSIDACVRASIILGGRKSRRKKTLVHQGKSDPVFNEKFFFEIPPEKLNRVQVLVLVSNERETDQDSDTDTGSGDVQIGQVLLGYRASSRAHAHWMKMTGCPRDIFAQWYELTS